MTAGLKIVGKMMLMYVFKNNTSVNTIQEFVPHYITTGCLQRLF
jgi:hypothetical protein